MNHRGADLRAAKRVVEDVAWLSFHQSYVQAAKRLGEVLRAVEQRITGATVYVDGGANIVA